MGSSSPLTRSLVRALLCGALAVSLGVGAAVAPQPSAAPVAAETGVDEPGISRPTLSGSTRVGGTMRAKVRVSGDVAPVLRYDWLRDGRRIGGAEGASYKIRKNDLKHRISVRVTARFPAFPAMRMTSKKSQKIRPRVIDDPKTGQVVVNKRRPLQPKKFVPSSLTLPRGIANGNRQPVRKSVAKAVEKMHKAAKKDGVELRILSAYRSYALQKQTFDAYVARDGREAAETYSARPGHSEHQTGLAVDFGGSEGCNFDFCFASTAAGKWLKKNAAKYGFIMRYPKGYTKITGYIWEPYHFRYVGKTVALDMKKKKIRTLEQYRGLKAAPDYR